MKNAQNLPKISISYQPSKENPTGLYVKCGALKERIYFGFKSYGSQLKAEKAAQLEIESLTKRLKYRQIRLNMPISIIFNKDESIKCMSITTKNGKIYLTGKLKIENKYTYINKELNDYTCFRDVFNIVKEWVLVKLNHEADFDMNMMFNQNRIILQKTFENTLYSQKVGLC